MKILYISSNIYISKKRTNFHHLCNESLKKGKDVTFCTAPNSISTLLKDKINGRLTRFKTFWYALFPKKINGVTVSSYISFVHPAKSFSDKLNNLFLKIYRRGYSKVFSKEYDVIVIDSGTELLLFNKLKKRYPNTKFIYRVSDSMDYKQPAKVLFDYEKEIIGKFDVVSSTSNYITNRLSNIDSNINIHTTFHGVDKKLFDQTFDNPYKNYEKDIKHFVFIGASRLDYEFLNIAKDISSDYIFHIIGPFEEKVQSNNIIYHGYIPFEKTVAYLKYADICLQTIIKVPHSEFFERTLKFVQYTYLKKPIISPSHVGLKDPHVFNYDENKKSISNCLLKALEFDKSSIDTSWIKDWSELEEYIVNY